MAKPEIGSTGWGGVLNDHLDDMATDITARQVAADLDVDTAALVAGGGATEAALSATYGSRMSALGVRPAPQTPPLSDITFITRFEAGHGWNAIGGAGSDYDLNSTDRPYLGERALKYGPSTTGGIEFEKTGLAVNLSGREVCFWVRVDNEWSGGIVVFLGDSTYANFKYYEISSGEFTPDEGWVCVRFDPRSGSVGAGALDLTNVQRIKFRVNAPVATHTMYVSAIGHVAKKVGYTNGAVSLTFDDSANGVFSVALPRMQNYGYPGVVYAIGEVSENAGETGLCLPNLHRLVDLGWDVGGHADRSADHVDLDTLTDAQLDDTLGRLKDWLVSNGFQGDHLAYPYGTNNEAVRDAARRYFKTGRTVAGSGVPSITSCPAPTNRLFDIPSPSFDAGGFTLANMMTAVTNAANQGLWLLLTFHAVNAGASAGPNIGAADLDTLLAHIQASGCAVVTPSDLFA